MNRSCRHTLATMLMLSMSSPLIADKPHWQQPAYIEKSFLEIALQREHGPGSGRLNKWQSAIHYKVVDHTGDTTLHAKMVSQQMQHLASITGLSMSASQSETANLSIIFTSERQLDTTLENQLGMTDSSLRSHMMHDSVCVARIHTAADGSIQHASVLIPVDRARAHAKLMACVVEELTQVLGLANDSAAVYPSVFNDRSFNDFLTGLDYLLLKLMYSPRLTAGMSSQQVKTVVHQLVTEQAFQSEIHSAEQAVRANSLENWLD